MNTLNGYSKSTLTDKYVLTASGGHRPLADSEFIVGTQTAATGSWTGVSIDSELYDGKQISYWLPYNGSGNATLNLTLAGGSTTGAVNCYYGGTSRLTTHYSAGNIIRLVYRENVTIGSTTIEKGWWADANYVDGNTYTSAWCGTAAATAAKTATCSNYTLRNNSYIHVLIRYTNTAASALTLNINSTGAKPIYINGVASSKDNYSLYAGTYIVFYNGTNYYFNTDDSLPGKIKDSSILWGTDAIRGDISPIDSAASYLHSGNKLQFASPEGITIEYSTNGGSTWVDYGTTEADKIGLVSGLYNKEYIIGKGLSTKALESDQLRITLHATNMGVYTRAKSLLIDLTTSGSNNCKVKVETATKGNPSAFSTRGEYPVEGWSGWNRIPLNNMTFGGSASQTSHIEIIRLTFTTTGTTKETGGHLTILSLLLLGVTNWRTPSNMAKTGHLYSWDSGQNAIFPTQVTATQFNGSLIGNASSATKLKTARKLWGQNFDGSVDVSGDMTGVGNINIYSSDQDKYITFDTGATHNWRIAYLGTGAGNANYLSFQSSKDTKADWTSALTIGLLNLNSTFAGKVIAPTFQGNLDGSYVNALTDYAKATAVGYISETDSLNTALGKLEFKTDFIYNDLFGTDNDDVINKWHEIVDFVDSVAEDTDITDEFVTRKTPQTITGQKNFNTNTNSAPLVLSRNGLNTKECVSIGVDDNTVVFNHIQDEKTANYTFKGTWLDTENSDGSKAGNHAVYFNLGNSDASIKLDTYTVYHTGNLTKLSQLENDSNFVTGGPYLPLAGGVMNNGAKITFNANGGIIQTTATTSNATELIQWYKGTAKDANYSYSAQIGWHNMGNTDGAIYLIPNPQDSTPWGGSVGLYIGKNTLKWNNNNLLHSGNSSVSGGGSSWGSSITVKINGTTKTLTIPAKPTIPTVTDYYWANIKVSETESTTTTPTFGSTVTLNSTGNVILNLTRTSKSSWRFLNEANLRIQNNYTSEVVDYFDVVSIAYNTGNVTLKGSLTASSSSDTVGIPLVLKNTGWKGNMSTAIDFYNGAKYTVPNARIATYMSGDGRAGGTLVFYTQTAHATTNPNPNGLTERLRIGDNGNITSTSQITLYSASGDSPHLVFQRGTTTDGTYDWDLYDTGGHFKMRYNNAGTWSEILSLYPGNNLLEGYQILTAGNWSSYITLPTIPSISITNSGSGNAVTSITASGHTLTVTKGSTFATSSHTHYYLTTPGDKRSEATTPGSYSNIFAFQGLKNNATIDSPSSDTYSYLLGLRGWSDSSGGNSWELAFNNTGIYTRKGASSWGNWEKIAFTSNIPTKTSQLTNDSDFITSRGYIGTTPVQDSQAAQSLSGIIDITATGNYTSAVSTSTSLYLKLANKDTAIGLRADSGTVRGVYDYGKSKWLVYSDGTNGTVLQGHTSTSSTWSKPSGGTGAGIKILNAVNSSPTEALSSYSIGLEVSGYYSLQLASKAGVNDTLYFKGAQSTGWVEILHAGNSSISGGGSTWGSSITVKINGESKTLTIPSNPNTWRPITDAYDVTSPSSTTSLSQTGAESLQRNVKSFKRSQGTATNGGYDLNTLTEGMVYNYGSTSYWKNGPSGMSYGRVLNLKDGSGGSISGQLAWDTNHGSTTDTTRYLWWRVSDDGTFTEAKWHRLAYVDDITKSQVGLGNVQNTAFYKRVTTVNGEEWNLAGTNSNAAFTIYAPTTSGSGGDLLISDGSGSAPVWTSPGNITVGGASKADKLTVARTIALSGAVTGSASFNGSANITIATSVNHTHSYLPLSGGTLTGSLTVGNKDANEILSIAGDTSQLKMMAYTNATYIESGNKDWNGNTPLHITGYGANRGSELYLNFNTIYCRGANVNLDSGNWSNYITIPTVPTLYERNIGINGNNWTFSSPYNTATTTIYAPTSAGTSGQVLVSTGGIPTWQTISTGGGYIGTTAVQSTSQTQNLTGIGNLDMSGKLTITGTTSSSDISMTFIKGTSSDGYYDYKIGNFTDSTSTAGFGIAMLNSNGTFTKFMNCVTTGSYSIERVRFNTEVAANIFRSYGGSSTWAAFYQNSSGNTVFENSSGTFYINSKGLVSLKAASNQVVLGSGTAAFYPNTTLTLGTSSQRWNYVYATHLNAEGGSFYTDANGAYWTSDFRLKTNIIKARNLNIADLLVEFDWKESNEHSWGYIAQDLLEVLPEAVSYNADTDRYAVNYNVAHSAAIASLTARIKELEEKLKKYGIQ